MPELELLSALAPDVAEATESARAAARARLARRFAPRRRPMWAVPAGGMAAAGVVAALAALFVLSPGRESDASAARVLRSAAGIARAQRPLVLHRGEFLYVKSINAYLATTSTKSGSFAVLAPNVREVWLGPTGGHLREHQGAQRFLSDRDRAAWIAAGKPSLAGPPLGSVDLPPLRPLDLPSDPDALYKRLEREAQGNANGVATEMFTLVGDALRETNATPAQRAALYEVAARIPGVELVGRVDDPIGRTGIAVAHASASDGIRTTLILDPATAVLLAEEEVTVAGNSFGYPPGTVIGHSTYVKRDVVRSMPTG